MDFDDLGSGFGYLNVDLADFGGDYNDLAWVLMILVLILVILAWILVIWHGF